MLPCTLSLFLYSVFPVANELTLSVSGGQWVNFRCDMPPDVPGPSSCIVCTVWHLAAPPEETLPTWEWCHCQTDRSSLPQISQLRYIHYALKKKNSHRELVIFLVTSWCWELVILQSKGFYVFLCSRKFGIYTDYFSLFFSWLELKIPGSITLASFRSELRFVGKLILLSFRLWWNYYYKIWHMPRQLCCCGMCQIL